MEVSTWTVQTHSASKEQSDHLSHTRMSARGIPDGQTVNCQSSPGAPQIAASLRRAFPVSGIPLGTFNEEEKEKLELC